MTVQLHFFLLIFLYFLDFEKGENFCHFLFKDGIVEKEYQVHFSDEYPGMYLTMSFSRLTLLLIIEISSKFSDTFLHGNIQLWIKIRQILNFFIYEKCIYYYLVSSPFVSLLLKLLELTHNLLR